MHMHSACLGGAGWSCRTRCHRTANQRQRLRACIMLDDSAQAQAHAEACTTTGGQTATAGSPTPPFARAGSESSMFSVSIEMAPGFETRAGPGGAPGEGGGAGGGPGAGASVAPFVPAHCSNL